MKIINNKNNTKGIFRKFWISKENGQIAPFLIVIIIILLVALMAYINISQVNLRKLSTMNAADSAALAGAAQLAGAANEIADMNVNDLLERYNLGLTNILLGYTCPNFLLAVTGRYGYFTEWASSNLSKYAGLLYSSHRAGQQAGGSGLQSAFSNMPIEEASQRKNSYSGELQESRFSDWLENETITTTLSGSSNLSNFEKSYEWQQYSYNLTQGRQTLQPAKEKVTVKIHRPGDNAFKLWPAVVLPSATIFWRLMTPYPCPPPPPPADSCTVACWIASFDPVIYNNTVTMPTEATIAAGIISEVWLESIIYSINEQGNFIGPTVVSIMAGITAAVAALYFDLLPWVMMAPTCPGTVALTLVLWPIPFSYIFNIGDVDSDFKVSIEVTRFSPTKDLGLFQFKQQEITSGARAGVHEGHVYAPGSYKVKVEEVWDGKRL